jgi:hypothetical protein
MILLLAFACANKVRFGDTAGADDTGTDTYEYRGPEPVIFSGDAVCASPTWTLSCTAGDQQGRNTIVSARVVIFRQGDGLTLGEADLEGGCAKGVCTGTVAEDPSDLSCQIADAYKFQYWVKDADGNESRAYEVPGREK